MPGHQIAAAVTEFGDMALIYVPEGGDVELRRKLLPPSPRAAWINGRTGERLQGGEYDDGDRHLQIFGTGSG